MKATVVACSNLALIKYWGNRDDTINIPINDSISISLGDLQTTTTVDFDNISEDTLILNGNKATGETKDRFGTFLSLFRKFTGMKDKVRVESENNFPTSAGIASSSSGFGALAHALLEASQIPYNQTMISRLARLGSGSAARSPIAGYAHWHAGTTHESSYATQLAPPDDLQVLVVLTDYNEKKISSIEAMRLSKKSSPFFYQRGEVADQNIEPLRQSIVDRDFTILGKISQQEANNLHAVINTTGLGIYYWNPLSLAVMNFVNSIRTNHELPCYYTIDAGPQIKILVENKNVETVKELITDQFEQVEIIQSSLGFGSKIIETHLF